MIRAIAVTVALIGLSTFAAAQDAPKAEQLVGKWKLAKSSDELPPGAVAHVDFAKDGKLNITMEIMDKKISIDGTWKIDGKKLSVTMKMGTEEKTEVAEITKLTADDLVTKDEKGKTDEFKKVKADKK